MRALPPHFAAVKRLGDWLTGLLPPGTAAAGAGVAVLGLAAYVHLAVAGHALSQAQMADLSVLWSIIFSLGYGLYFPIEQEVTRVCAARHARAAGTAAVWRRGSAISALILGGIGGALVVTSGPVADRFFLGDTTLVLVTFGGLFGLAVASPIRGVAAGTGRFDLYGAQLGLDGVMRVFCAIGLALLGFHTAAAFGVVLALAPVLASVALIAPVRRTATAGPRVSWAELGHGLGPLMVSASLGQLILNSAVVSVRLLAPQQTALAAALLAALVLIRVPLFVFAALQASLLAGLASAIAAANLDRFRSLLRHASAVVTGLVALAAVPAVALGPWLIQVLFNAPAVFRRVDFAILTVGTWAYLLALVFGQAAMALHRHRVQMAAWIGGSAMLVVVTLATDQLASVALRVELAYALSCATVAGALAVYLVLGRPTERRQRAPARLNAQNI